MAGILTIDLVTKKWYIVRGESVQILKWRIMKRKKKITQMLEYPLPLRKGIVAKIILPDDLTNKEADRVVMFIRKFYTLKESK